MSRVGKCIDNGPITDKETLVKMIEDYADNLLAEKILYFFNCLLDGSSSK